MSKIANPRFGLPPDCCSGGRVGENCESVNVARRNPVAHECPTYTWEATTHQLRVKCFTELVFGHLLCICICDT